jgi:hypothetical protein
MQDIVGMLPELHSDDAKNLTQEILDLRVSHIGI